MRNSNNTRDKYRARKGSMKSEVMKILIVSLSAFLLCIIVYLYFDMSASAEEIAGMAEDISTSEVRTKENFAVTFMDVSIATDESKEVQAQTASGVPVSIVGNGIDSGIILNNYLRLYNGPTITSDVARVVNVGAILDAAGISKYSWSMGEGFPTSNSEFSNANAFTDKGGHLTKELCDSATQTVNGRYLVAVGPGVMVEEYKSTYVGASDMKYGTSIDVVIKDSAGTEYYIPCVVADCKAHTYGNGVYQTGISIDKSGNLDDQSASHADGSVVEFCTKASNVTGSEVSTYAIDRIIVYEGNYN